MPAMIAAVAACLHHLWNLAFYWSEPSSLPSSHIVPSFTVIWRKCGGGRGDGRDRGTHLMYCTSVRNTDSLDSTNATLNIELSVVYGLPLSFLDCMVPGQSISIRNTHIYRIVPTLNSELSVLVSYSKEYMQYSTVSESVAAQHYNRGGDTPRNKAWIYSTVNLRCRVNLRSVVLSPPLRSDHHHGYRSS